jgi:hypothetical protein
MKFPAAVVSALCAAGAVASASAMDVNYAGFGTIGAARTDSADTLVGPSYTKHGVSDSWDSSLDSKVGMQLSLKLGEQFSTTVQAIARQQPQGEWGPSLDWAYVQYKPSDALTMRAGQMRLQTMMFSDTVFLDYANTWVRAPTEAYYVVPVFILKGGDLTWQQQLGKAHVKVQPFYGTSDVKVYESALGNKTVDFSYAYGLNVTAVAGSWTVHAHYSAFKPHVDSEPLVQVIPLAEALGYPQLADQMTVKTNYDFMSLGVQYDDAANFVIAEANRRTSNHIVYNDVASFYVTAGRRLGDFTPYLSYARQDILNKRSSNVVTVNDELSGMLDFVADSLMAGHGEQSTYSIGVRYELPKLPMFSGSVLKLQYDRIEPEKGAKGLFLQSAPVSENVNMICATFSYMF